MFVSVRMCLHGKVLEYKEPNYGMRKQIWDNFLRGRSTYTSYTIHTYIHTYNIMTVEGKLQLHEDVDTSVLAIKYELTGGFIKNAGMYVCMYVCMYAVK